MTHQYQFDHAPNTCLNFHDDEAIHLAKTYFNIIQLPNDLYHFLKINNGGTPVKQMFFTKNETVFTIMTFLYLFVAQDEKWEANIDEDINLLSLLELYPYAKYKLFPFAKTYAGDYVAYSFDEAQKGKIFLIELNQANPTDNFKKITLVYDTLNDFYNAAR